MTNDDEEDEGEDVLPALLSSFVIRHLFYGPPYFLSSVKRFFHAPRPGLIDHRLAGLVDGDHPGHGLSGRRTPASAARRAKAATVIGIAGQEAIRRRLPAAAPAPRVKGHWPPAAAAFQRAVLVEIRPQLRRGENRLLAGGRSISARRIVEEQHAEIARRRAAQAPGLGEPGSEGSAPASGSASAARDR